MTDWSLLDREWQSAPPPLPYDPYQLAEYDPFYREKQPSLQPPLQPPVAQRVPPQAQPYPSPPSPTLTLMMSTPQRLPSSLMPPPSLVPTPLPCLPKLPKVGNPRQMRNKEEKLRRDRLNQSISELASLVPPVVFSSRKIDKTGVLRYTAHYLRAHQYVFDQSKLPAPDFTQESTQALLGLLNGFLITTTYKGLIVVISPNVTEYLGYTEMDLLGKSIFSIVHEEDRQLFQDQLKPKSQELGKNGELLMPDEEEGRQKVAQALASEKRQFFVRFSKLGQRSEPSKYVTCHVEGSLRMSDRACRGYNRCCQMVRRARARGDSPSSGNDVVFIGIVHPSAETFINETALESYKMEYRTRHSIDGEIIQCEQRIALVTGYMTNEVSGVNAMNFIHRDEVRWVIFALREMYNQNQLFGESCYRLMTKNGQFIYMRTRGKLDVDVASRAVTSFVCTNTVVEEDEGKHLIKLMKERFTLQVNNNDQIDDVKDANQDSQAVAVEDPRQLEKVILKMVTNLPSPEASDDHQQNSSPLRGESPSRRLSLIPPKKERIVSAIEKIYTVIKTIPKQPSILQDEPPDETTQLAVTTSYSEPTEIAPFYDSYFLPQSGSETELYSETTYSPATSSDFGLSINNTYDEIASLTFGNSDVDNAQPDMECQMLSWGVPSDGMSDGVLISNTLQPGPTSTAGTKRPNIFDDQEMTTKKKIMDVTSEQNPDTAGRESPNLETFFDEAILNNQIEKAMDSLDEVIDPSFPDLLISKEVEEILEKIQAEPDVK